HRDVMRRVEADRGQVAEGTDATAPVRRTDRIAAILDQPQVMLTGELGDSPEVKRVAECVSRHDRASSRRQGGFQLRYVEVIRRYVDIDEHRHQAVLDDRVDRGREAGGDGDDLV